MNTIITPASYSPSHNVNNGGVIKYNKNPLKGFLAKDQDGTVKRAALAGSAVTTLLYLATLAKFGQRGAFKVKNMFNMKYGAIKAIGLATSSVLGGLAGGLLTDKKENKKPKLKEAIHQFLGNIITPITIVGIGTEIIGKTNLPNKVKWTLDALAGVVGVGVGVTGGNWIASKVNGKIFKENDDRKVGIKDFGIHVDDVLTVIALATSKEATKDAAGQAIKETAKQAAEEMPKTGIQKFIGTALPLIFLICGYEAGTKKLETEKPQPKKEVPAEVKKA